MSDCLIVIINMINTYLQRMEFLISLSQKYLLYPVCIAFLFVQFSCMHIGIWPHNAYCVNINLQWHLDICLLLSLHFLLCSLYKFYARLLKLNFLFSNVIGQISTFTTKEFLLAEISTKYMSFLHFTLDGNSISFSYNTFNT